MKKIIAEITFNKVDEIEIINILEKNGYAIFKNTDYKSTGNRFSICR